MEERLQRWRLILGTMPTPDAPGALNKDQLTVDTLLAALYDDKGTLGDQMGSSGPIHQWLGDIRKYFPLPVVRILQKDAMEKLDLRQMLQEPELLASLEVDVTLVANILQFRDVLPEETRETAAMVIQSLVDQLRRELTLPLEQARRGRHQHGSNPSRTAREKLDWRRTILANLGNYQPKEKILIPSRFYRFQNRSPRLSRLILVVDQSGSMSRSVVHASIIASILAGMPSLETHLIVFDTEVADLTPHLSDPISLLFSVQLGGGTHIARALGYAQTLITHPSETTIILISDLYEGDVADPMFNHIGQIQGVGVRFISLLSLDNEGVPSFDKKNGARLAAMGLPAFACTPREFPTLIACLFNGDEPSHLPLGNTPIRLGNSHPGYAEPNS